MKTIHKLWILIAILAVLAPIGLVLPEHFRAGAAWGEWSIEEIKNLIGYIPKGLEKLSSAWSAPLPDYALKGQEGYPAIGLSFSYVVSAILGIIIVAVSIFLIGKFLSKKE